MNEMMQFIKINSVNGKWFFFDCFETILFRSIAPDEIKTIWATSIVKELNIPINIKSLLEIREEAEYSVSHEHHIFNIEYKYEELCNQIYLRVIQFCGENDLLFLFDKKDFYIKSKEIEEKIEMEHHFININVKEAMRYLKEQNINIGVISDFYMGADSMRSFLKNIQVIEYIDKIFVSSDFLVNKESGELYHKVTELLSVNPKECIMIGDNRRADYVNAKKVGMAAFHLEKESEKYICKKIYTKDQIVKEIKILSKKKSKIPYVNYAFSLYLFIERLYLKCKKYNIKNLLFCARDGQYIKRLFDLYSSNNMSGQTIKTHYFFTSRIASFVPGLKALEEEDFNNLFRKYKDLSIISFLKSIGYDDVQIGLLVNKLSFNCNTMLLNFCKSKEFHELIRLSDFREIYEVNRVEQNRLLRKYLADLGIDIKEGLFIVDAGWTTTLQDNLFECFEQKVKIRGFYIGVSSMRNCSMNNIKEGLLFSEYPVKSKYFDIWNFDKLMYERILMASHASVFGYKEVQGKIEPVLKEQKNDKQAYATVEPLHKEMEIVFTRLCEIFTKSIYLIQDFYKEILQIHLKMLCLLDLSSLRMQKKLYDYKFESFGEFGLVDSGKHINVLSIIKKRNISVRKIISNGFNFKYLNPIALTTVFVARRLGFLLLIFYRILYVGERKRIDG